MFLLDAACAPLRCEFPGYGPYLVGTAAVLRDESIRAPRDVDVRHIMADEEYATFAAAVGVEGVRFLGIAIGQYLASLSGLPIDFQFQQFTAANSIHPATPRIPLGVRSMANFVGDAEPEEDHDVAH